MSAPSMVMGWSFRAAQEYVRRCQRADMEQKFVAYPLGVKFLLGRARGSSLVLLGPVGCYMSSDVLLDVFVAARSRGFSVEWDDVDRLVGVVR